MKYLNHLIYTFRKNREYYPIVGEAVLTYCTPWGYYKMLKTNKPKTYNEILNQWKDLK